MVVRWLTTCMSCDRRSATPPYLGRAYTGWIAPASPGAPLSTPCRSSRRTLYLICAIRRHGQNFLATAALWCVTGGGVLAEVAMTGTVKPFGSVPFAPDRDVACLASALETGDPLTGASTWILNARPGCVVPWHSHTAEEQLIIVRAS